MQKVELPYISTKALRGSVRVNFKRPNTYLAVGLRDSGKSSLIETLAVQYPKIVDLFCSRDCEALAWCRSPLATPENVLFITGDSTEVDSPWDSVKISKLRLEDFERYKLIITVPAFARARASACTLFFAHAIYTDLLI